MFRTLNLEESCSIFVVDLTQNLIRQVDAIDAPSSLRRNPCGRIVEVFVFRFEKAVVDFVKLVVEDLLRKCVAVWSGVGGEQDAVLVLVEEFLRRKGLAA